MTKSSLNNDDDLDWRRLGFEKYCVHSLAKEGYKLPGLEKLNKVVRDLVPFQHMNEGTVYYSPNPQLEGFEGAFKLNGKSFGFKCPLLKSPRIVPTVRLPSFVRLLSFPRN